MDNRLDFLMNLTGTRNSVLSKAISFDPSYISRIRTGKRAMPDSPQFIEPVAAYFSRNIRTDYQRAILAAELSPDLVFPEDREELQKRLEAWLYQRQTPIPDTIGGFLQSFSASPSNMASGTGGTFAPDLTPEELAETIRARTLRLEQESSQALYFYGNEGKRRAVELFLGRLCCAGRPFRLLLFSDEEMSWLYEDAAFAQRWTFLLYRLLSTGSHIRIPHYTSRDSNEMFQAVEKWIPLYMTGAIEPYSYPRLRDGVYHRSLFIASGESALVSSSVGNRTEGMLNILLDDKQAVAALEQEYDAYLALCQPLMYIYGARRSRDYFRQTQRFEKEPGELIIAHPLPSFYTMPPAALQLLQARCSDPALSENHARSYAVFRKHMRAGDRITEILHLPDPEAVRAGTVSMPICDFYDTPSLTVSARELALHLKNVIRLLKREQSYQVFLSVHIPADIILCAKEHKGAQLLCAAPPTTAFFIHDPGMTTAILEYLLRIAGLARPQSKDQVIHGLESYIRMLEK